MKFVDDGDTAVTPAQEWLARVSPFLAAADPHQRCVQRAREAGLAAVNSVCDCPHLACAQPCCTLDSDEWTG